MASDRLSPAGRLDGVGSKLRLLIGPSACGRGETGRRKRLKIFRPSGYAGSTPAVRTTLLLLTALGLAACGRRPDDIPVSVSVIGPPIVGAGPAAALGEPQRALALATRQGLVRFDGAGGIEPALAERWIVIDGGRSYIFRLADARWTDGSAIDAEQVAAILRRTIARRRSALAPYLAVIDEIVAMTPQVLEVRLKHPRQDLLKLFAQSELAIDRDAAGSGPFRWFEQRQGEVVLRPVDPADVDPDETADAPSPEQYVRLRGEAAATAIARFAARQSDLVAGGTYLDWPMLVHAAVARANVHVDAPAGLFGFAFVHRDGFLRDPANRVAIAGAIAGANLPGAVRDGWAPIDALLPERLDSAADPAPPAWAALGGAERLDQARRLVSAAARARGEPIRLRIALPDAPGATLLYGRLAATLTGIGVVPLRVRPGDAADLRLVDEIAPYDSARWYLHTACQPCGTPVAARINAIREAPDLALRAKAIAEADAMLAADVAFIPVARPLRWALVATRLSGWTANARGAHPLNHLRPEPK